MQIRKPSLALDSGLQKMVGDIGGRRGLASHPSHTSLEAEADHPTGLTPDDLLLNLPPGALSALGVTPEPYALQQGRRRSGSVTGSDSSMIRASTHHGWL